jgi:hypothetical protein
MSQIFAAQLDNNAGPISEALSKIVEDEQKRREAEAQDKTTAMKQTTMTWSGRPMMSNFCGLDEANEVYLIPEIKNAGQQCHDFDPMSDPPQRCGECRHRTPSRGKAEDLLVEQTTSDMSARNVTVGLSTSVPDSLLTTHREGVSKRIGFELTGAYNSAGHLAMEPRYFDYCGHYSTPDDYVVCLMRNPHHICPGWKPTAPTETEPANPPAATPAASTMTERPMMSNPTSRLTSEPPAPPIASSSTAPTDSEPANPPAAAPPAATAVATAELARAYLGFWQWMFDVPLPEDVTRAVVAGMLDDFGHARSAAIAQINDRIALYRRVSASDAANRAHQREQYQGVLVAMLRADSSPIAQRLLAVYDAANPVLAVGPPPLTPETADCYLDLLAFMRAAIAGVSPQPPEAQARAAWRQKMTTEYDAMTPELRTWIADTPRILAGLRAKWASYTDAERAGYILQWSAWLGVPPPPPPPQRWSDGAPDTVDGMLAQILRSQEEEERRLEATNPELALQQRMQNASANAQLLSNIMKARHDASMAIIGNMR